MPAVGLCSYTAVMGSGDAVERVMSAGFRPVTDFPGVGVPWQLVCMVCGLPCEATVEQAEAGTVCSHVQQVEGVRLHGLVKCYSCGVRFKSVDNGRLCPECSARDEKQCRDCDQVLPMDAFPWKTSGGRRYRASYCKDCYRARHRANARLRRAGVRSTRGRPGMRGVAPADLSSGEKRCPDCEETKRLDDFYTQVSNPSGYSTYCRECSRRHKREHRQNLTGEELEEYKARRDASVAANPMTRKKNRLRDFHLTLSDWEQKLRQQQFRCAICGQFETATRNGAVLDLGVDHDHDCCPQKGRSCGNCVRGLLCGRCNRGLGYFGDNADTIERAIAYVVSWQDRLDRGDA
jgi:hypothetical protein